ncbi:flagellar hook-associated protein 2 [Solibacillus sp. FSL K6-1523]|uniref:flagellar hook-associated protein 2 n=1 Tax=Solibacillus sp. FSL K6-1523 TaxID=2921471 RepID=UPI0030F61B73
MVMRIGGLASGMDIDSMVEKLMQAEKAPLNKLYQQKQKYEWQRDAYRDVNKKLKAFDDFLFKNMTLQKDLYKKSVSSSNPAISAIPTSAINGQTLTIDSVSQIAKSGNAVGTITPDTAGTKTLGELGIVAAGSDEEIKLKVLQNDGTTKDVSLTFSSTDTINNVVSKLKKDTGLNAFYDEKSGQIAISTTATGKGDLYKIEKMDLDTNQPYTETVNASVFVESGGDFFGKLGFNDTQALVSNGQNAKLTINGAEIERQSNTFEIDGFNVTLNNTYTETQPITLTTKTDSDNMMDKIKEFVETYNSLVESFTDMTKEKRHRDFPPLTDEQKKDMKEDEIKSWEEKAKSGILRSDSLVTSALSKMRTTMYEKGSSSNPLIDTLYEMGITTSNKISDNGKLVIDEDKLRAKIEEDPDAVFSTFSNATDGTGIVQKLRKNISATTIDIEKRAGRADSTNQSFNIGRNLESVEDRINAWKTKLSNIEQRYWKQFGAMEAAINKANQQSSIFAPQQ